MSADGLQGAGDPPACRRKPSGDWRYVNQTTAPASRPVADTSKSLCRCSPWGSKLLSFDHGRQSRPEFQGAQLRPRFHLIDRGRPRDGRLAKEPPASENRTANDSDSSCSQSAAHCPQLESAECSCVQVDVSSKGRSE